MDKSARSAFQSEKPQIAWFDAIGSAPSYHRVARRTRYGFAGETPSGRVFAGAPLRLGSSIWNKRTTVAEAGNASYKFATRMLYAVTRMMMDMVATIARKDYE